MKPYSAGFPERRIPEPVLCSHFNASIQIVQPGVLRSERLVNMSKHQYRLEPNPSFTPDQKWVVFRSNMFGPSYVFAVEVAKAAGRDLTR